MRTSIHVSTYCLCAFGSILLEVKEARYDRTWTNDVSNSERHMKGDRHSFPKSGTVAKVQKYKEEDGVTGELIQ